jgi:hypothetical protein
MFLKLLPPRLSQMYQSRLKHHYLHLNLMFHPFLSNQKFLNLHLTLPHLKNLMFHLFHLNLKFLNLHLIDLLLKNPMYH